MNTVLFIHVLYILTHLIINNCMINGAERCESSIETRAVLLSCPEKDTGCEDDDPLTKATMADEYRLLPVSPSEIKKIKADIESEFPTRITDCKRKLVITMKLNNKGKIDCDDGFIVIDHVYDPITRGKARLLSPVIIKLRQEQMVQLYPLQFQKIVNSNPNENIFTKETCSAYEGCSMDLDNPTCGITTYDGEPIPFSEGFCCSCDQFVNARREVLPDKHENTLLYKDPSLFGYQKNRISRSRETKSVLINPHLLNLRAGNRQETKHLLSIDDSDDDDDPSEGDELFHEPPNFFFERDRQIVCAPEALLRELCNLDGKDQDGKDDDESCDDDYSHASNDDLEAKQGTQGKNNSAPDYDENYDKTSVQSGNELNKKEGNGENNNINNINNNINNNVPINNNNNNNNKNIDNYTNISNSNNSNNNNNKLENIDECNNINNNNNNNNNNINNNGNNKEGNNNHIGSSANKHADNDECNNIDNNDNDKHKNSNKNSNGKNNNQNCLKNKNNDDDTTSCLKKIFQNLETNSERREHNPKMANGLKDIHYFDTFHGNDYQFAENKKFIAKPGNNVNGEFRITETGLRGKDANDNVAAPRHRMKRLIRDNDMYGPSPQHSSDARGRRKKRILNVADRKMLRLRNCDNDKPSETCQTPCPPNCTLPIYFFCNDKKIICPSANLDSKTSRVDKGRNPGSPEYEDSNLDAGNENENVEEIPEAEQPAPPLIPVPHKTRLHTNKGDMWDVNTNSHRGNILTLDLIKSDNNPKDETQEPSESIEQINYERKKIPLSYNDRFRQEIMQTFKECAEAERMRSGYGDKNVYSGVEKLYSRQQNGKENLLGSTNKKNGDQFNREGQIGMLNSNVRSSLGNMMPKISIDLRTKDLDALLRGIHEGNKLRNGGNINDGNRKVHDEFGTMRNNAEQNRPDRNEQRFEMYQNRKDLNIKKKGERFYDEGENEWKKSYYQTNSYEPEWADKADNTYEPSGRDNIVELLALNHSPSEDMRNKYLVRSKNVFFADSKPRRNTRRKEAGGSIYGENMEERRIRKSERAARGGALLKNTWPSKKDSSYKVSELNTDYFAQLLAQSDERKMGRSKREAGIQLELTPSPSPEFHSMEDSYLISPSSRNRWKRAKIEDSRQEPMVKISKWEHRTPPGPEYQFDESKLAKPKYERLFECSSGTGNKQNLEDIQRNFAKFKLRRQDKLWDETRREMKMKMDRQRLIQSYVTSNKYKREVTEIKGKRHKKAQKRQERGGQDCSDDIFTTTASVVSEDENCDDGHESTHCMSLSDLWYSVYLIKRPELSQLVGVQIYDRQTMCDGTMSWRDVTKGYMVRLGSFLQRAEDDVPTISMTFTPTGPNVARDEPKLDTENYRLLIPSHLTNEKKASLYPEFYGGPNEFMLVKKEDISTTGADCNKIGTSFEAFARQADRCSKPPGSCLKRQPVDLWREDMEARIRGKRGKYFIENFGNVSNTSIKSYSNLTGDFLAMDYFGEYSSIVEIEMRADGNAIVRQGENAQIPSVYIDSMTPKKIKIVLSVINMGMTSSYFRPRLGECPPELDPTWCPLEGPLVLIPPHQRHDFKLELSGALPVKKVYCAVEVLNYYNKKVARRRIIIKKTDRCFCAFYCKCLCLSSKNSVCIRMSKEDYNAAGYFDPLPQKRAPQETGAKAFFQNLKIVLISMIYALFVLGFLKAILGLLWRRLGTAGVQVIVGPRTLCRYYEHRISCYQVIYDECGFPIHPQTCKTVQVVPKWVEMFLNFLFFYLYLLKVLWLMISSSRCCRVCSTDSAACSRFEESDDDSMCRTKGSNNYSANYFNYNVTTFTTKRTTPEEKVLYNPYRGDEDPLEEDDTEFVLEEIKRYKNKNSDE